MSASDNSNNTNMTIITTSFIIKSCIVLLVILITLQLIENRAEEFLALNNDVIKAEKAKPKNNHLNNTQHEPRGKTTGDEYYYDDSTRFNVGEDNSSSGSSSSSSSKNQTIITDNDNNTHQDHQHKKQQKIHRRIHSHFRQFLPSETVHPKHAWVGRNWPDQAQPPRVIDVGFSNEELEF